ncbi:DoxX family protein [Rhizobium sp. TRM95111]|uniref:DoxX family protein n=1 Tax=Rhizobium alarense TaxID=2846851 RepID=UPI001F28B210|nr:DoxX family protein [Rhizobium alarense]MCF3640351.1 DoxX family protein [Rhizobium alarense]
MKLLARAIAFHDGLFDLVDRMTRGWFLPLFARFVFLAVLYLYYLNSALTKVGDGLLGFFTVAPGAYYQIALPAVDAAGGDPSAVPFLPWGLIVVLGTYSEFLLPILIVAGLATRLAAVGMIGFIAVQTLVDITVHAVDAATIGALFDRFPDSLIADQRLLWIFPLIYLALNGGGSLSLDHLLGRRFHICPPK